ncbi:methionine-R-sulfoxide reductase B3 isoform X1 [Petaurus breviceps papuanus]|uniref:methionine-R-sulfoxide reductase B3 isoform X1 n=1 Tax=Petaurus breviceps papuanus TaxID=3040969 RepID=UPI0036DE4F5D
MSAFNLLHLVTKSQPVAQRACGLPSGSCRDRKNCKVVFSQQELRKRLTPLQYHVTQEKGTESAFEGKYTSHKDHGMYKCVVCGTPLFNSETKYDSGSGWPSFHDVINSDAITFTDDFSHGMHRVETSCSQVTWGSSGLIARFGIEDVSSNLGSTYVILGRYQKALGIFILLEYSRKGVLTTGTVEAKLERRQETG